MCGRVCVCVSPFYSSIRKCVFAGFLLHNHFHSLFADCGYGLYVVLTTDTATSIPSVRSYVFESVLTGQGMVWLAKESPYGYRCTIESEMETIRCPCVMMNKWVKRGGAVWYE